MRPPATPGRRRVEAADADFLCRLYVEGRVDEGRRAGVPDAVWRPLLAQQFSWREHQYREAHPDADDCLLLDTGGGAMGRMWVDRSDPGRWRVVDLALLPSLTRQGVGSALLRSLQREAAAQGAAIELQVANGNPAIRLYERLGFQQPEPGDDAGAVRSDASPHLPYWRLCWQPPCAALPEEQT